MKIVTRSEAEKFTSPYIGKTVSRVWSGAGSSVILEVGDLFESKGELTITCLLYTSPSPRDRG